MRNANPFQSPTARPANIINRIVLFVDASLSMKHLSETVVQVFDNFIAHLAVTSKAKDQETRVTVYTFSSYNSARCIIWDMDVLRVPSLAGLYHASGNTALVQTFLRGVREIRMIPTMYGDNSAFFLGLTDGEENDSVYPRHDMSARRRIVEELSSTINNAPDDETYGLLVPNQAAVHEAMQHGFPRQNISVWDASSAEGLEEAGSQLRQVVDFYMDSRAQGVRGFSARSGGGLFRVRDFTAAEVTTSLTPLRPGSYVVLDVPGRPNDTVEIRPFVEGHGLTWVRGECFYEPTKAVKLQDYKRVIIEYQGQYYTGEAARQLLGLPDHNVTVNPGHKQGMTVFFQSNSVNRNLFGGTRLVVKL